jgi:hypothetical protein
MKIDRTKLSLIIASLCGTCASATAVGQDKNVASSGRIGDVDSSAFVDSTPNSVGQQATVPAGRPVMFQSPEFNMPGAMPSCDCNSYQTSSCGSGCGPVVSCSAGATTWFETETLLWWGKGFAGTPQVVGGNTPSVLPTNVLAGGDNLVGNQLQLGYRFTLGTWLDCDQNYGLMGRVFGLIGDDDTTTYTNGGNTTGLRFFDTSPGVNNLNTYLVNLSIPGVGPGTGTNSGTITVGHRTDLVASDVSLRVRLLGDGLSRGDFIGGYSFLRLDSAYQLSTVVTDGINNLTQDGTVLTTTDIFGTKNEFHGGHVGFINQVASGRFSLDLLGKVAMGNMRSTRSISGSFSEDPPIGATVTANRGIFAQSTNSGLMTRDRFTFVPEAGAKLKYQIGQGQFGVGYTLLVLPSVAMAANQIDTNVSSDNFALVPIDVPRTPVSKFNLDTYFLHGIDLGYTMSF